VTLSIAFVTVDISEQILLVNIAVTVWILNNIWTRITELWLDNPEALIAIIALGVSIFTIYFQSRTVKSQEMHTRFQRLIEVYNLTNDPEHRESRKNIYKAYKIYKAEHYKDGKKIGGKTYTARYVKELLGKNYDNIFSDPIVLDKLGVEKSKTIQQDVERVRATFDHIGALFNNKLIPEETLLKAMWGVGIYCWDALENHINIERDARKTMDYTNNFQDFYKQIEDYVKREKKVRVSLEDTNLDEIWTNS